MINYGRDYTCEHGLPWGEDGCPQPGGDRPPTSNRHLVSLEVPRIARTTRWVWGEGHSGWIPRGALTLLAGREGGGKSTVLARIAADITRGRLPGVHEGQPRYVLYAATEDSWPETITPRMIAAGADMDLIREVKVVTDEGATDKLSLPVDTRRIPDLVREMYDPGVAVLMLDPVLSFLDDKISTNRAQELRKALEPLVRAAEQARIGVVGLVHFNKNQDTDINSMIAGSRAWAEVARSVLAVAYSEDDEHYILSQTKNSRGRLVESITYTLRDTVVEGYDDEDQPAPVHVGRVVWGEATDTNAEQVLQRRRTPNTNRNATDQILQFLAGHMDRGWPPGEIATQTGIAAGTVRRVLGQLRTAGRLRLHHGLYFIADPPDAPTNER